MYGLANGLHVVDGPKDVARVGESHEPRPWPKQSGQIVGRQLGARRLLRGQPPLEPEVLALGEVNPRGNIRLVVET